MAPTRRWQRLALVGLIGLFGLIGLLGLVTQLGLITIPGLRGHPAVMEVWTTDDDLRFEVILDTCNADVSVDVDEYDDRVVIHAWNHDWYRLNTGSDDCLDVVPVELEQPLGDRRVTNSSGDEIVVTQRP